MNEGSKEGPKPAMMLAVDATFFHLNLNTPISTFYFVVDTLACFLHELSFPFAIAIQGSTAYPVMLFQQLRILWETNNSSDITKVATAYAVSALILSNVAYVLYLVRCYSVRSRDSTPPGLVSRFMNYHFQWSMGPLCVPYLSMISYYVFYNGMNTTLFNASPGEAVYFVVVMALHTLVAMLYNVSVMNWSPLSQKMHTKAHGRVFMLMVLFKAISSVSSSILLGIDGYLPTLAILIYFILYQILLAALFFRELPFYSAIMNQVFISIYALSSMASLATTLRLVLTDSGDTIYITLFFIASLLLLPTVYVLIQWRLNQICSKPLSQLKSTTQIDIRARIEMNRILQGKKDMASSFITSEYSKVASKEITSEVSELTAEKETAMMIDKAYKVLNEIFSLHGQIFPVSFKLNTAWATYAFYFKGNRFLALQKLRQSLHDSPFFFDVISLQVRLRGVAEVKDVEEGDTTLASYVEQQRLQKTANETFTKCLTYHLRFWGTLISHDYNLALLESLSEKISQSTETCKNSFQKLIVLNPRNASNRRLYSQFLLSVMNDDAGAKRQLTRAVELESDKDHSNNITDDSNCIFILSLETETFGHIVEANEKACQVFGTSLEDMQGRKITSFMAHPYTKIHNAKLLNYIEKGAAGVQENEKLLKFESKVTPLGEVNFFSDIQLPIQSTNPSLSHPVGSDVSTSLEKTGLLMRGMNGFVFSGDLRIREFANYTSEPSLILFGSIRIHPTKCLCVVSKKDWHIVDVSSLFFSHFSPDMLKIRNQELTISEVIPQFREELEQLQQSLGENKSSDPYSFEIRNQRNEGKSEMTVNVTNLKYLEDDYWVVQVDMGFDIEEIEDFEIHRKEEFSEKEEFQIPGGTKNKKDYRGVAFSGTATIKNINQRIAHHPSLAVAVDSSESGSKSSTKSSNEEESNNISDGDKASSRNSSSLNSSKSGNLLRLGLVKVSGVLEQRLRMLLFWIIGIPLLLSAVAICQQVVSTTLNVSRFSSSLNVLYLRVRTAALLSLYSTVMFNHIFRNTFASLNNSFSNELEDQRIRRELSGILDNLVVMETSLLTNLESSLTSEEVEYVKTVNTTIVYADGYSSRINLIEMITYIENGINAILHQNITELQFSLSTPLDFFRQNMNNDIPEVWNTICEMVIQMQASNMATVSVLGLYVMIASISLVSLVVAIILFPSLYYIYCQRVLVYHLFEKMEPGNIRNSFSICMSKLVDYQGEEETNYNIELQDMMEVISSKTTPIGNYKDLAKSTAENPSSKKPQASSPLEKGNCATRIKVHGRDVIASRPFLILLTMILITLVYFGGFYVWWNIMSSSYFKGLDERVYLSRTRYFLVREIVMEFMKYSDQNNQFNTNTSLIEQLEDNLFQIDHALYFGDPNYGFDSDVRLYSGGDSIMGGDVCSQLEENNITTYNTTPCETFGNGVFNEGGHAVILRFISLSQGLRRIFNGNATQEYLDQLLILKSFSDNWIPYMSTLFDNWIQSVITAELSSALEIRIVGTAVFVVIWIGIVAFVYIPLIYRLNYQLQKTRNMLSIIPNELIENSRAIRDELRLISLKMIQSN